MYSLPTYIFRSDGTESFTDGAIISLPAELGSNTYVSLYRRSPTGWHVCGAGYWYYAFSHDDTKRVIAGIVLDEERAPKKKFYFPPLKFRRSQIESIVQQYTNERNAAKSQQELLIKEKEAELGMLVHDLRTLSTAILHAGEEARRDLDAGVYSECRTRIENILATQTLLSIRIDGLDFAANPLLLTSPSKISVFRKVDKVVRSLRPRGNTKRVRIEFEGSSYGYVFGPDVFELIPFAILDNAIKYSPAEQHIDVAFEETPSEVGVRFKSIGPKIEITERAKIFEKNYRGTYAAATGVSGTGIGLSIVNKLVSEFFGGRISVTQSKLLFEMNMVPYHETEFFLQLPRHS